MRTLSAIRQRTLTVRCSLYLFTVHVYTHKKIVHHHYYISSRHPLTSWIGQSECLKTIIYIDSACIQCSLKHTHTNTHSLSHRHSALFFYTDTCAQSHPRCRRGISVALFLTRAGLLHLHSTLEGLTSLSDPYYFGNVNDAF